MGGGSHGHHEPYTVPDYRIYKVSDIPLLVKTQEALAVKGLKDPWLRNEVWRYSEKEFGSPKSRFRLFLFRGFKVGVAAFVVTIAGTAIYDRMYPSEHDHGHGSKDH